MADEQPAAAPAVAATAVPPTPPPPPAVVALEKRPGERVAMTSGGVALTNLADLMAFSKMAVEAGAAPKGMTNGQAAIAIAVGLERGLGAMGGLQALVIINGVVSWRGSAALGMIQQSGLVLPGTLQSWVEGTVEGGDAVGIARGHRVGYQQPFVRKFSLKDAQKAGLWNKDGPWKTRPTNMLEWRAVGDLARFHFPEALSGIPIAEDVEAGGVGPVVTVSGGEMPAEKPATALPEPPAVIHDPILERFGAAGRSVVDAELVPAATVVVGVDPAKGPDQTVKVEVRFDQSRVVAIEDLVGDALELKTLFDAPAEQQLPEPLASKHVRERNCKAVLNAMNGCDVCGWPGKDDFR